MRWIIIGAGIVMLLLGTVWLLQGINVLRVGFMAGQPFWATVGLILIVAGVAACYFGFRSKSVNPQS